MRKELFYFALKEEQFMEVNVRTYLTEPFRDDLRKAGFITSRQLRYKNDGDAVKVAGRLTLVQTPPTKTGIRVMFVTIEDEWGLIDLVLFPQAQKLYAKKLLSNLLVLCKGRIRRLGKRDISIVVSEVMDIEEFYRKRRNKDKNFSVTT